MRARQNFVNELARLLNSSDINLGTLLKCIQTFFAELDNVAKSIKSDNYLCQTLGLEAREEIVEEIKNLFYLDPKNEDEQKLIQALENLRENLSQQSTPVHSEIFDYITLLLFSTNYKSTREYFETELARAEGVQEIEGLIGEMLDLADEILARSNDEQLKADMRALRYRYGEIIDRATLKAYGGKNGEMLMTDFNTRLTEAKDVQEIEGLIGEMLDLADEILARSNDEQLKADIDALRNRYREIIDRATLKAYGEANGEMLMADFNARLAQAQKIRDIQAIQGIIN